LHLGIVPDSKVVLVDQADLLDAGGLDKDQPEASEREGTTRRFLTVRPRILNGWNSKGRAGSARSVVGAGMRGLLG
jgi:hypothetical protein